MKKISNPLTIVAIFASIAETAGTVVLPLVRQELQNVFIVYVMALPILVVVLFFITWNFNPKVLYSPNDFTDESNYMETLKIFYDIKKTVEKGKENGEKDKEIIDKVYNSVSNEIRRAGNIETEIIKLLSKNPQGLTLAEIAENLSIGRSSTRRKLMLLYDMQFIEKDYKITENNEGMKRRFIIYKLAQNLELSRSV